MKTTPTTKILAIGTINPVFEQSQVFAVLPEKVRETVDLYLDGKKTEAAAAVPDALIDEISLVGPPARIRDRLQAWQVLAKDGAVGSLVLTGADAAAMRVIAEAVL